MTGDALRPRLAPSPVEALSLRPLVTSDTWNVLGDTVILLSPPFARQSCSLTVSSSASGRYMSIAVAGEADWSTADLLEQQLVAALTPEVVSLALELGELTFCNLRGLGALHEAVEAARKAGIDVTVRGMSRQLSRLHAAFPDRLAPLDAPAPRFGAPARRRAAEDPVLGMCAWESSGTA